MPEPLRTGDRHFDGAILARDIRPMLEAHPAPLTVRERFENQANTPRPLVLERPAVFYDLDQGIAGFVYYVGGDLFEDVGPTVEQIGISDILALGNAPDFAFHLSLRSSGSSLSSPSFGTALVQAPDGGAAGVLGFSDAAFPSSAGIFARAFVQEITAASGVRIGDAMREVLIAEEPSTAVNSVARWTAMTMLLFGDPAMAFRSEPQPVSIADVDEPRVEPVSTHLTVQPTPSPGPTAVAFRLDRPGPVSVRVVDTRSRVVATLFDGRAEEGSRALVRDTDDLANGLYFVRVETYGRVVSEK